MSSIVKSAIMHWASPQRKLQSNLCETCGLKPKFVENGVEYNYCSRSCARDVQGNSPAACSLDTCRATGKPAFAGFCTEEHAKHAVRAGLAKACFQCNARPAVVGDLCIACNRRPHNGVRLREMKTADPTFRNMANEFRVHWESSSKAPPVIEKVYEVVLGRDIKSKHEAYRKAAGGRGLIVRAYYGAQCLCDMGAKPEGATLCTLKSCGICATVKSSFNSFAFDAATEPGQYGYGIYSYQNSAKADEGATSCTTSPYRVMVACEAIVEDTYPMYDRDAPMFLRDAAAIIPVYIVVYNG